MPEVLDMILKCAHCGKAIKTRKDLVVTLHTEHSWLAPHHVRCHPKAWQKKPFQYLTDVEISSRSGSGNIILAAALLLDAAFLLYTQFDATANHGWLFLAVLSTLLAVALLGLRLASWLSFERWFR